MMWGGRPPKRRCEVPLYASIVARLGERERWIAKMMQRIDWACDSFALRPSSTHTQRVFKVHSKSLRTAHYLSRLRPWTAKPQMYRNDSFILE